MLDIHAHLHDLAFDADRDAVVKRAFDAGVTKIITIGTDTKESRRAVACAERHEGVYASVGIHPDFFNETIEKESPITKIQETNNHQSSIINHQEILSELKEIALSSDKVVAIGECGLDYYNQQLTINSQQKKMQKDGFVAQIEIARELQLPLIIHCRPSVGTVDSYEDIFLILKSKIVNLKSAVLHCYMGDTEVTKKFLELPGIRFSFTGNITYSVKKSVAGTKDDLTEVVKMIPIDRMLAETDCPYLAPVPYRGKRNEPAYVVSVIEKIAELKGISRETAEQAVIASVEKIFSI
ncbi:MAG: TatD family hydrolase [Candidatus Moranbacteria bacterium]|jgi:TatD DNase family protein|nr:TatD family hydrolase [Candidatus Moranbacteria bacterium]MDQ5961527.1 TatD DNase family protein [Patescibacteria group bacterium]